MNVVKICERAGAAVFLLWLYLAYCCACPGTSTIGTVLSWGLMLLTLLTLLLILDIYRLKPYGHLTLRSLRAKYSSTFFTRIVGLIGFVKFYRDSRNVVKQQEELLSFILTKRKDTEYGRKRGFCDMKCAGDFRSSHPITTYNDYKDYMERSARGEKNILTDEEVLFIGMTSGTTGKNKIYPIFKSMGKTYMTVFGASFWFCATKFPELMHLRSSVSTRVPKELKIVDGIKKGPVSAMSQDSSFNEMSVTPGKEVNTIYDERKMMYIHAVFGLGDREVLKLDLSFVSLARSFFHCLETEWESICDDIAKGKLTVDIDNKTKQVLESYLSPEPERAAELRQEFRRGFRDIAPRVWPHLGFVAMLTSGPLASQAKSLARRYFSNIPVLSTVHISTEGMYGLNMDPGRVDPNVYTVVTFASFFEFIPVEEACKENPRTVLIQEVEIGKEYEIVITNFHGLYRYRSGDVIKIVSYYNQIPQYEFQYRLGQMLNVYGERSTEGAVQAAVDNLVESLPGTELVNYTTVENSGVDDVPELKDDNKLRYYVILIELDGDYLLTDEDKERFDALLCDENEWYATYRQSDYISSASVHQVKSGAFIQLKQKVLETNYGTAAVQFKMPRVQRKTHLLQLLADNRIES